MILPILCLGVASFLISWIITCLMIRVVPKLGFVDRPGGRKIHANPKPLGGGVALLLAFALPMLAGIAAFAIIDPATLQKHLPNPAYIGGIRQQTAMALAFLGGCLVLHIVGLIDDRKALGPFIKLIIQLLVAAALAGSFREMRWRSPRWARPFRSSSPRSGSSRSPTHSTFWTTWTA